MNFKTKEEVEYIRAKYPVGTEIKLVHMDDPSAPPMGTVGKVIFVDDIGQIHWTGSGLAINLDYDRIEIVG